MPEIIITCFFFIFLLLIGVVIWRVWVNKFLGLRVFILIIVLKLTISLSFSFIYSTYYANSDTTNYFFAGSILFELIDNKEYEQAFRFLKANNINSESIPYIGDGVGSNILKKDVSFFMAKITGFFQLFTFNSFFATALIFSFISLIGLLRLFSVLVIDYQESRLVLILAIFFYPTILFWTSGILKDTVVLLGLTLIVSSVYELLYHKKNVFLNFIAIVISAYLLASLRIAVLLILFLTLGIWLLTHYLKKIKKIEGKLILYPITFGALTFGVVGLYILGESLLSDYGISSLLETAQKFQLWHTYLFETGKVGSGYILSELELTPIGISSTILSSLNVSLFRPYVWEVSNAFMIVVSLESLALFIISVIAFLKVGFIKGFKRILDNPFLFFTMSFALIYLAVVGFISYNFGALVRYKVVGILFYVVSLALMLPAGRTDINAKKHIPERAP